MASKLPIVSSHGLAISSLSTRQYLVESGIRGPFFGALAQETTQLRFLLIIPIREYATGNQVVMILR